MLKRGTWNFKKNAKRPFLWQRSAGNQDRCSDHFLRTLIFKLEGWKVFDNNGLGVKIHWKCWIHIVNIPFHMQNQHEFDLFFTGNCHDRISFAQIQSISRKFNYSCNERIFLWWIIYFAWNMFHTWFHEIFLNDIHIGSRKFYENASSEKIFAGAK